jgi:hypothetical protein
LTRLGAAGPRRETFPWSSRRSTDQFLGKITFISKYSSLFVEIRGCRLISIGIHKLQRLSAKESLSRKEIHWMLLRSPPWQLAAFDPAHLQNPEDLPCAAQAP